MTRHIYRGYVIDTDNLGRPYIYNTASPYSEDSDKELVYVDGKRPYTQIKAIIDERIEQFNQLMWYIVDDCTSKKSDVSFTFIGRASDSRRGVEYYANQLFNDLTDHDKALRDAYYVVLCNEIEPGIPDLDSAIDTITIK